jgi:hypothetical protein
MGTKVHDVTVKENLMTILEVNAHFYLEQDVEEDFVQLIDDREGSFFCCCCCCCCDLQQHSFAIF